MDTPKAHLTGSGRGAARGSSGCHLDREQEGVERFGSRTSRRKHAEGDGVHWHDQADRVGIGDHRADVAGHPVLRGDGTGHRSGRRGQGEARQDRHWRASIPQPSSTKLTPPTRVYASDEARLSSDESNGSSTSQIDSDEAAVTSAKSQVASAQQNLADAKLTSTIAGTVASVSLTVGQSVSGSGSSSSSAASGSTGSTPSNGGVGLSSSASSSSSSASSGSGQIVVVSTNSFDVDATVDDTQVGQIKIGDQVTVTPSDSSTAVYGTVTSVGLVAQSSSNVASFPIVVAITGTPSGLYAGSSASLSITTVQLNDVVEVPTSTISYSNGQATVTKVVGGSRRIFSRLRPGRPPAAKLRSRAVSEPVT